MDASEETNVIVYVFAYADGGCKVGSSANPRARARGLVRESGRAGTMVFHSLPMPAESAIEVEHLAHAMLYPFCEHGERFAVSAEIACFAVHASAVAVDPETGDWFLPRRKKAATTLRGDEIRLFRLSLRMSQLEFGRAVGVKSVDLSVYQTVGRWERGTREPDKFYAERIEALKLNPPPLRANARRPRSRYQRYLIARGSTID